MYARLQARMAVVEEEEGMVLLEAVLLTEAMDRLMEPLLVATVHL